LALDTNFKHSGPSYVDEHLIATRRSDLTEGLNQAQLQRRQWGMQKPWDYVCAFAWSPMLIIGNTPDHDSKSSGAWGIEAQAESLSTCYERLL